MNDMNIETSLEESRLVEDSGVEARICAVIDPVIKPLGYRLVRVRLSGLNGLTLQIMAERADGSMSIEDCEQLSRAVSPVLDVEDLIERKYHLEVSSPGIDRPLVRRSDFANWRGHLAKVETTAAIDGKRKFRGLIAAVDDDGFMIEPDKTQGAQAPAVRIAFAELGEARLILTDALIRDALRKDKTLRKQQTPDETFDIEIEDTATENLPAGK